jgi:hypothetical protein
MLQAATCSTGSLGGARPRGTTSRPFGVQQPHQQQRRVSGGSTSSSRQRQQQQQALCSTSSSHQQQLQRPRRLVAAAAAAAGGPPSSPSPSSFEGSNVAKELQQAAALDDLIDLLLAAKTQAELSRLVAENVFSFDPKFWMRVATRNDSLVDAADKDRLRGVADAVMLLVDAMVKQTEAQLNDSASLLQTILRAAADANGEWYLPLEAGQVAAVRASLEAHADRLDEALLSNCFAWMKKCQDDRMDTMVLLLQKVLQLYAGQVLRGPETNGPEGACVGACAAVPGSSQQLCAAAGWCVLNRWPACRVQTAAAAPSDDLA